MKCLYKCSKNTLKKLIIVLSLLLLLPLGYSQSYSVSEEDLTTIESSIMTMEQTIAELDSQLKEQTEQLKKQEAQLKKSKKANKILIFISAGLASSIAIYAAMPSSK